MGVAEIAREKQKENDENDGRERHHFERERERGCLAFKSKMDFELPKLAFEYQTVNTHPN